MIYKVGPSEQLKSIRDISSLTAGDEVEIRDGLYRDARAWPIAGTPGQPIVVRAANFGKVMFDGADQTFSFTPRAIFQVNDGHYKFQGIKFRNATNGNLNAAAIRCVKGSLIVEDCWMRNCSMGIQTTDPYSVEIRRCNVGWCGFGNNSHNIYLSGGHKSIIEDSIFERTCGGINVKIRTRYAEVRRNRILNSIDGELQFCDGPETLEAGADAICEENEIRTLVNRGRGNIARVVAFGHEGKPGTDRNGTLIFIRNKILLRNSAQILVSLDSLNAGLNSVENKIEGISNKLIRVRYGTSGPVQGLNNSIRGELFQGWPELYVPSAPPLPPDITAPTIPKGLTVSQTNKTIVLNWEPSPESDIAYYEVDAPWGPYSMGNEPTFTHVTNIYPGRKYTFTVTAVDFAGNRSAPSEPISIVKE